MQNPFTKCGFEGVESDYKDLDIYKRESVTLIALNKLKEDRRAARQAANHIDGRLISELKQQIGKCNSDESVSSMILTSSQLFAFCRGAKIELLHNATPEDSMRFLDEAQDLILTIQKSQKPIICANNGLTLGGGFELTLACDYRISSDRENVLYGLPETSLGIIPGMGGTQNLKRLIGRDKAHRIVSEARIDIDASEALRLGVVDEVAPANELIERAFEVASSGKIDKKYSFIESQFDQNAIADEVRQYLEEHGKNLKVSGRVAPLSRLMSDFIFEITNHISYLEGLAYEREILCALQPTKDCQEGLLALMEEREPKFVGE